MYQAKQKLVGLPRCPAWKSERAYCQQIITLAWNRVARSEPYRLRVTDLWLKVGIVHQVRIVDIKISPPALLDWI